MYSGTEGGGSKGVTPPHTAGRKVQPPSHDRANRGQQGLDKVASGNVSRRFLRCPTMTPAVSQGSRCVLIMYPDAYEYIFGVGGADPAQVSTPLTEVITKP